MKLTFSKDVRLVVPLTAWISNSRALPRSVRIFLELFIRRVSELVGIRFYANVPSYDDVVIDIYRRLDLLKKEGIVKNYFEAEQSFPDEPRIYGVQVNLTGDSRLGYSGYGRSITAPALAWGAAYGEALERWCLDNFAPPNKKIKSYSALEIRTQSGIDLTRIAGIGDESRKNGEYAIHDHQRFSCVPAYDIGRDRTDDVPLQWFTFTHARSHVHTHKEPKLFPLVTTGAAAGQTKAQALLGGTCEIVERDAFMIHWLRKITPTRIGGTALASLTPHLQSIAERYQLEIQFLYLATDFPVHVVACVVFDRTGKGPAVAMDASAGPDLSRCIEKAFMGAVGLRPLLRRLRARYTGDLEVGKLILDDRALWWYEPDKIEAIQFFVSGPTQVNFPEFHSDTSEKAWDHLAASFREKQMPLYYFDIIPPHLATLTGTSVVSMKAPFLIPMHLNEWERSVKGERLWDMPHKLGLSCGTDDLNPLPHPFA